MNPKALSKERSRSFDRSTFNSLQGSAHFYSDGEEVENRIADIVNTVADLSLFSDALRKYRTDWPTHYHLSPSRANLLRPLSHCLKGSILEVGAGCGALTRYLGELGSPVLAIEGSHRRALIASRRCRDLSNVQVIQEVFDNFQAGLAFDAVIFVGVLEYCRVYGTGPDPALSWLKKACRLLKQSGCLILAIENQLGLKYFAGVAEDHLGTAMSGIGDLYDSCSPVTFGRAELERTLRAAGFNFVEFAIPIPDYKLPTSVILPEARSHSIVGFDVAALVRQAMKDDGQLAHAPLFPLGQAWGVVARNDLLLDLANSFLIVARIEKDKNLDPPFDTQTLAYHFATERRPKFCKQTVFRKRKDRITVEREFLVKEDSPRSSESLKLTIAAEEYTRGKNWGDVLESVVCRPGWTAEDVSHWLRRWMNALVGFLSERGHEEKLVADTPIPGSLFDALPRNLIVDDRDIATFVDLEWEARAPIEYAFLVYRALTVSLGSLAGVAMPTDPTNINLYKLVMSVMKNVGLTVNSRTIERYLELDATLRQEVFGSANLNTFESFLEVGLPVVPDITDLLKSWNKTAQALTEAQTLAVSRFEENRRQTDQLSATQTALENVQKVAFQRANELEELQRAITETQSLALLRFDEITQQRSQLTATEAALKEVQEMAVQRGNELDRVQHALTEASNLAVSRHQEIVQMREQLDATEAKLKECATEIGAFADLKEEFLRIINSRSWRWTKGLRSIASAVRQLKWFAGSKE